MKKYEIRRAIKEINKEIRDINKKYGLTLQDISSVCTKYMEAGYEYTGYAVYTNCDVVVRLCHENGDVYIHALDSRVEIFRKRVYDVAAAIEQIAAKEAEVENRRRALEEQRRRNQEAIERAHRVLGI